MAHSHYGNGIVSSTPKAYSIISYGGCPIYGYCSQNFYIIASNWRRQSSIFFSFSPISFLPDSIFFFLSENFVYIFSNASFLFRTNVYGSHSEDSMKVFDSFTDYEGNFLCYLPPNRHDVGLSTFFSLRSKHSSIYGIGSHRLSFGFFQSLWHNHCLAKYILYTTNMNDTHNSHDIRGKD